MVKKSNGNKEVILRIIEGKISIKTKELLIEAKKRDIEAPLVKAIIKTLMGSGMIYRSQKGMIELVDY